jgi:hypothetical protein
VINSRIRPVYGHRNVGPGCMADDILQGQKVMVEVFNSINGVTIEENHERLAKVIRRCVLMKKI